MPHIVTTGPDTEPLVLADVKLHLKVDTPADDDLITALIVAARGEAENYTNTKIYTQSVTQYYDCFPGVSDAYPWGEIRINYGPIQSIDAVKYVDTNGVVQTWNSSNYRTDIISTPARIVPAFGLTWPITREVINAVQVEYTAGYSSTGAIPQAMKQAMLLTIGHWYENRVDSVRKLPTQAMWLLNPYRIILF